MKLLGKYVRKRLDIWKVVGGEGGSGEEGRWIIGTCLKCVEYLKPFCDLYCEMERIRLQIDWRLGELVEEMERGGRVPSRMRGLKEGLERQGWVGGRGDDGGERAEELLRSIRKIRTDIVKSCNDKLTQSRPNVLLQQCNLLSGNQSVEHSLEQPSISQEDSMGFKSEDNNFLPKVENVFSEEEMNDSDLDNDFMISNDNFPEQSVKLKNSGTEENEMINCKDTDPILATQKAISETGRSLSTRPYACRLCPLRFITRSGRDRHNRKLHNNSKKTTAGLGQQSNNRKTINTEQMNKETTDEKEENSGTPTPRLEIECILCSKSLSSKNPVIRHLRNIHKLSSEEAKEAFSKCKSNQEPTKKSKEQVKLKCPHCTKCFTRKMNLQKHIQNRHARKLGGTFPCSISQCNHSFDLEEDLKIHRKLHGIFNCSFCDITKDYAPDISKHEVQEHSLAPSVTGSDVKYNCARCKYTSASLLNYTNHHLETHLGLTMKAQSCKICQARFISKSQEKEHFRKNHATSRVDPGDLNRCTLCPAYFLKKFQLFHHKRLVHKVNEDWRCTLCNKIFNFRQNLKQHMRKVHKFDDENPDLPVPCDVADCKKRFNDQDEMEQHKLLDRHKLEKFAEIVICPECKRECKGADGLRTHMKSHNRSYVCEQCGLGFKKKSILTQHYLFHKGPEGWDYQCQECGKKCQSIYRLQDHMRVHSKEKRYECKVCGSKYACRQKLRNHVNRIHKEEGFQDIPRKKAKPLFVSKREVK